MPVATSPTHRVLVYDGPHEMHVEERAMPQPGAGETRIRLAHIGICGSDLHGYTGESGRRVPGMVMGHEASGWVDAHGAGARHLPVGTPVTFNPALACDGRCGHRTDNQCAELRVIGVAPEIQGAFADTIVVPAGNVMPLGEVDLRSGAAVEPMAVAMQAVRRGGVEPGEDVLVIGGGMIGQAIARIARSVGASAVTVVEQMADRRTVAADAGFDAVEPDAIEGLGPFHRTFDAVGITATATAAIRSVVKGGTACFVGLGRPEITLPLFDVVVAERTIVGTFAYPGEVFRDTVADMAAGRVVIDDLAGASVPFTDAPEAFAALARGDRTDVKVLVSTGADQPAS